jgi:hypothetical protein
MDGRISPPNDGCGHVSSTLNLMVSHRTKRSLLKSLIQKLIALDTHSSSPVQSEVKVCRLFLYPFALSKRVHLSSDAILKSNVTEACLKATAQRDR